MNATESTVLQVLGVLAFMVGLAWALGPWALVACGAALVFLNELIDYLGSKESEDDTRISPRAGRIQSGPDTP